MVCGPSDDVAGHPYPAADCEEGVRPRGYRFRGGGDDASVRRYELSLGNRVCVFPVLTGKSAERFLREVERVNRLPRRERPVDYYDYIDRLLEKSKKFVREHEGLGFRLD